MKERLLSYAVGGYLLLCIGLGGSATTVWMSLGLQLAGIAVIAWAAIAPSQHRQDRSAAWPYLILLFGLVVVLLQLIPLPPDVWAQLPGRAAVARSIDSLGYERSWAPISQTPYASVLTLFAVIPAIAVFVATERLAPAPRAIAVAMVAGMIASVFVGTVQLATGPQSWAYLQDTHNVGATGFFANSNHMGTLLVVTIPMAAALVVSAKSDRSLSSAARLTVGAALLLFIAAGIVMNGSRAALGLGIPVILASLTLFPWTLRWRVLAIGVAALILVGGVVVLASNPIMGIGADVQEATQFMRSTIWATTGQMIRDNLPFGTGLGSFEQVYHWYETAGDVTRLYVNHAHNDYLELVAELGGGGLILVVLFLAWWIVAAFRIWSSSLATPFARAATIASAAILAHSIVDFPLRTAAISAIFAGCMGLMSRHLRAPAVAKPGEIRPTSHVKLG